MAVDFDEIHMRQAIDQPAGRHLAHASKVICVDLIDRAPCKLRRALRDAVEHLVRPIEEMDRAEDEIQLVPVLLDPTTPSRRVHRIVVQLDPSADLHVGICLAQPLDYLKSTPAW